MTGFSFPPPPPPPPKAASSQQPEPVQSSSRGGGRGRGGRGNPRGRGGQQQRGGWQQSNPNYVPQNFNQNGNMNGTGYGGIQQQSYNAPGSFQQNYPIPPGAYVNPAFSPPQAQAQSAPVSQYGQPQQYGQQYGQQYQQQNVYQSPGFSPGAQKRSAQQAFGHSHKHPMKKPPSAPKVPAAPAVPSFGAPIPIPSKSSTTGPPSQPATKKAADKKRVNLFGLAADGTVAEPTAADSENEEGEEKEEEVDEEAAFASNISNEPMQVEYNGETYNLNSPAELAAWIAERKRNFPTRQRVEEKKAEVRTRMEERKRIEEETRAARLADPGSALPNVRGSKAERGGKKDRILDWQRQRGPKGRDNAAAVPEGDNSLERTAEPSPALSQQPTLEELKKQLEIQTQKMEEMKRTLAENEAKAAAGGRRSSKSNATSTDIVSSEATQTVAIQDPAAEIKPALPTDEATITKAISTNALDVFAAAIDTSPEQALDPTNTLERPPSVSKAPAASSDPDTSSSEDSSSSESDSDSDSDSAPEETSTRPHGPPRTTASNPTRPICRAFATHGHCKFGPKCRHKHESSTLTQLAASKANGEGNGKGGRGEKGGKGERKERRTTSLFRKMVEQEREEEGRVVLKAIRYLGGVGFFSRR